MHLPPACAQRHLSAPPALCQPATPRAVPRPSEDGRILDKAGYNLERSYALTRAIRDFESRINAPVYVVTLPSIGRPKSGVKDFATRLFNAWEIGRGGTQKGVLVLIVRDVRRVEVEVGKTLNGVVSHSWTTRMLANEVLPTLRETCCLGFSLKRKSHAKTAQR